MSRSVTPSPPPLPALPILSDKVIEDCLTKIGCFRAAGRYGSISSGISEQMSDRNFSTVEPAVTRPMRIAVKMS